MKKIIVPVIFAFAATAATAQQPSVAAAPAAETNARIVAELAAAQGHTSMKNSPVSFDEINESVQTLADGNRIIRNTTGKFYRNSEGRVRRETAGGTALFGSIYTTGQNVSILNPAIGQKYLIDNELKTARVLELGAAQRGLAVMDAKRAAELGAISGATAAAGADLSARLRTELRTSAAGAAAPGAVTVISDGVGSTTVTTALAPLATHGVQGLYVPSVSSSKYETRTEELGIRDFEGVSAEGTRRTTIIPAGAIGNERPIEIVYERWFSKDLGMVVFSKNADPRLGEQTYRITNIQRSEPDPSLFSVPTGYKRISSDRPVYRIATPARTAGTPATPIPVKSVSTSKIRQ